MTFVNSSGGGGPVEVSNITDAKATPIEDRGAPVQIALNRESTTVPSGETWIVTVRWAGGLDTLDINGEYVALSGPGTFDDIPLVGGDTISMNGTSGYISGWSV